MRMGRTGGFEACSFVVVVVVGYRIGPWRVCLRVCVCCWGLQRDMENKLSNVISAQLLNGYASWQLRIVLRENIYRYISVGSLSVTI